MIENESQTNEKYEMEQERNSKVQWGFLWKNTSPAEGKGLGKSLWY